MPAEAATETPIPELRTTDVKTWTIGEMEFKQRKLTFFEKNEFTGLVARAMDQTLATGGISGLFAALAMNESLRDRLRSGDFDVESLPEAAQLISLVMKIVGTVPVLMEDAYLIALGVPPEDRDGFRRFLRENMDDDTGFSIFETFIEQNATVLVDFFKRWVAQLQQAQKTLQPPKSQKKGS